MNKKVKQLVIKLFVALSIAILSAACVEDDLCTDYYTVTTRGDNGILQSTEVWFTYDCYNYYDSYGKRDSENTRE